LKVRLMAEIRPSSLRVSDDGQTLEYDLFTQKDDLWVFKVAIDMLGR
jgi:hypothetical protein